MAITQNTYTGNGSTVLYSFTFPYLETTDVKVTVNGVITTAYTFANATTIQFNTAPVAGAAIRIYRDTDDASLAATFYSGSAIRAQDLNDNFTQNLYVTQEVDNNSVNIDGSNPMVGPLNMNGFQITNLPVPAVDTNAATKKYVDDRFGNLDIPGHTRWRKVATASQTTFSGTGDYGGVLAYSPTREQVYINGALQQRGVDYAADNGTSVVFTVGLTVGDVVDIICVNNLTNSSVSNAGNITYSGQFTGQSARTVAAKLADVVSVKDFGAVGDGVTDDTAAIQAAIDSAKQVLLPAGNTFKTTANITVPSDKHVVVDGVLLRTGSGAVNAFLLSGNNITIDGSGEIRGPQYGATIVYESNQSAIFNTPDITLATQLKYIKVADLTISGWGDAGVEMWDVDGLFCHNLSLHDIGRIGLQAIAGKNITYSGNYVYDIGPGGGGIAPFLNAYGMSVTSDTSIVVPRPTNVKICNNTVIGIEHWEAYDLHGVDGAIIQNNTAIDCMIGIYVGASTGGNNQNCDNVVVDGNYLNNLGSAYSRAGILVAPAYTAGQYGDNIVVSDNVIMGHGTSQATYDAGYASSDGEGSILIVRTRNCVVNSNVITTPYQIGIHSRVQNLGTTISNNRVDSPVTANGEAVCFKGNDSDACIVSVVGNTWQRLGGSSNAVTLTDAPGTTYGYRYSESNEHIGAFVSVFSGSSYSLMHKESSYYTKLLCAGRVSLTAGGATLISGINIASVTRQAQGVVRVEIDTDALDANYYLSVTPQRGSFASATYNAPTANLFDILLWDSPASLIDIPFSFEVRGSAI